MPLFGNKPDPRPQGMFPAKGQINAIVRSRGTLKIDFGGGAWPQYNVTVSRRMGQYIEQVMQVGQWWYFEINGSMEVEVANQLPGEPAE